ncbi:uncharacterized protein [Drosophila tropicalis]|uniref:uncharacterized protein n=1 Tax=Drosophila tropicalis TaxID=46794 RepID=UPI0035ABE500
MEKTYVTAGPMPQQETHFGAPPPPTYGQQTTNTTYFVTGSVPPVVQAPTTTTQTIYVTTAPAGPPPPPPQVQNVNVVINNNSQSQKRQRQMVGTASTLFIYGGMDMAQGLGWSYFSGFEITPEYNYSWFIGVIIGAVVASLCVQFLPKTVFYVLGNIMELIDAIIFVSAPYEYESILAARWLGGVGIGLITVPFLIHSSEAASPNNRGLVSGSEQLGLSLGMAIQVIYNSQWEYEYLNMASNRVHGIFGIIFSAIALGSLSMSVESPTFYITRNQESKGRECQRILLGGPLCSDVLLDKTYGEAKLYVVEGESESIGHQLAASVMPFLKMLLFRSIVAFSFSTPLTCALLWSSYEYLGYNHGWPLFVYGLLRLVGAALGVGFSDWPGRKFTSLLGLICMAALMLSIAGIYGEPTHQTSWYFMTQVSHLCMAFQIFAGIYVATSSVYLGEAFPMKTKPYLIALIVCIEQVIHIIVLVSFLDVFVIEFRYFVAVGIIMVVALIAFAVIMPETRGMTLREAGKRFRRVHDVAAY